MVGLTCRMKRSDMIPAAIAAGCDMFLFFNDMDEDFASMMNGYKNGVITDERLDDALHRILALKAHMGLHKKARTELVPPAAEMERVIGCAAHRAMQKEISEHALTLVKYKDADVLPMTPEKYRRIMIVYVTGLEANTTYYYTVEKNGVQSEVQEYKTGSFDSVKMLYVGDPQIGASKGQPQSGEVLAASSGAANTAARNDAFAWNRTLEIATAQNPGVNFIISAGDQVNKTGQAKEEEYAGYLSPAVLAGLPVATTIGNHDSLNPDYTYHFNNPNATENGKTQAGGDYYYSYGAGLFIVLNTNNYNVAEHEKTIQEAIASAPDAAWRVVTIHQDIYGTGLDHSDTDGMILRTQLTPIFDKYDIDVVLQGHDHTYSRSKLLYGDGQTHGTYEFRLNADGSDYDWDNAFNTQTDEKIPLYPEEGDTASTALHDAFQADNGCYTIEDTTGNTVVNPKGTLYMTANSASGSKFYELIPTQQDYIAERSQNWLPSYSVIDMDSDSFSITTYQITAEGKVEAIDDTFTIQKTDGAATLTEGGETYYRLRDVAAAVSGQDNQFNVSWDNGVVITTGAAYADAVPAGTPASGSAVTLTLTVDGKSVTTPAVLANGSYYLPASFYGTLGVTPAA